MTPKPWMLKAAAEYLDDAFEGRRQSRGVQNFKIREAQKLAGYIEKHAPKVGRPKKKP